MGPGNISPRLGLAYRLTDAIVLRGGYGMFYDTLTAANYTPLTTGYSATTTRVTSNDFGQTWALGNPALGILPRGGGSRVDGAHLAAHVADEDIARHRLERHGGRCGHGDHVIDRRRH